MIGQNYPLVFRSEIASSNAAGVLMAARRYGDVHTVEETDALRVILADDKVAYEAALIHNHASVDFHEFVWMHLQLARPRYSEEAAKVLAVSLNTKRLAEGKSPAETNPNVLRKRAEDMIEYFDEILKRIRPVPTTAAAPAATTPDTKERYACPKGHIVTRFTDNPYAGAAPGYMRCDLCKQRIEVGNVMFHCDTCRNFDMCYHCAKKQPVVKEKTLEERVEWLSHLVAKLDERLTRNDLLLAKLLHSKAPGGPEIPIEEDDSDL